MVVVVGHRQEVHSPWEEVVGMVRQRMDLVVVPEQVLVVVVVAAVAVGHH